MDIVFRSGIYPKDLAGKRVLDLGCGPTGRFVRYLRDHGVDAYGLDSRPVARSSFLMQAEANEIPQPSSPYDRIFVHYAVFRLGVSGFSEPLINQGRLTEEENYLNLLVMMKILDQMNKVTQPGSQAIIVPYSDELEDFLLPYSCTIENILNNPIASLITNILYANKLCPALVQRLIINY